jgi:hypothetical protein
MIELHAFLSKKVAESALSAGAKLRSGDYVPFRVNPTKPFDDDVNFPKLAETLGITGQCDLCSFVEGVVGDVIDKLRTPDELGFRPRMGVYIRQRKVRRNDNGGGLQQATGSGARKIGNITLTAEEDVLVGRLKDIITTTLTPDQPCPVCTRVAQDDDEGGDLRKSHERGRGPGSASGPAPSGHRGVTSMMGTSNAIYALKADVGVQCGSASRVGAPLMPVAFGTATRLRVLENDSIRGGPVDFPAPATLGSQQFISLEGEVTDLKMDRDRLKLERDQLLVALRDEQRKVAELHRDRAEHKCEGNVKVQEHIREIERLQVNLRDLARGREEAHALLQQRRSAGQVMEGPRPYAPFALSVPIGEPTPAARSLLAKDLSSLRRAPPNESQSVAVAHYASDTINEDADVSILRQPSGHYLIDSFSPSTGNGLASPYKAALSVSREPPGCKDQPANQCFLRVASSTGDTYNVKRLVSSTLTRGSYTLVLRSMDQTVTDEIAVDDLQSVSVRGAHELVMATKTNEWVMFFNPTDRQRWVHWLYALNPWLSAHQGNLQAPV